MFRVTITDNDARLSLFHNPLPRVLKFDKWYAYWKTIPCGATVLDYGAGGRPYEKMLISKFQKYIAADYNVVVLQTETPL